ncbi:F-box protein [Quillaja saponaria]|uniref:F-box protein n=1 Tax=Quillaja saponaria TaxID=32244 RepID=A0AAD7M2Y1_QUISA|nr:F-box protein [Quillaja saponaria]
MFEKKIGSGKSNSMFEKKIGSRKSRVWIPDEIIVSILGKVPDKSLMRFKCVSKSWCSMISDAKLMTNTQKIFLQSSRSMYIAEYNQYEVNAKNVQSGPVMNTKKHFEVYGSCHGLLLIKVINNSSLFIWNSVTGESTEVPTLISNIFFHYLGFGYSHLINDYKIVRLENYRQGNIYSIRTDSWRTTFDKIPYPKTHLCYEKKGAATLANNGLFWKAVYEGMNLYTQDGGCVVLEYYDDNKTTHNGHEVIFRLDMVYETQKLIVPPLGIKSEYEYEMMEFKGCLCVIQNQNQNQNGMCIEMWLLKEEYIVLNWIKLMTIPHLESLPSTKSLAPIYFSKNGEVLLNCRKKMTKNVRGRWSSRKAPRTRTFYSYNPIGMTFKKVKVRGIKYWTNEIAYGENLVEASLM